MAQLSSIINYLDKLLTPENYSDRGLNGLQIESAGTAVRKVAVAVDAGLSVIEKAIASEASLLIVHHGLYWGEQQPIRGVFGRKIELLLRNQCSLYASHLPLDGHTEVGNAFELARLFKLEALSSFFLYEGSYIGARGRLAKPAPLEYFVNICSQMTGATKPLLLAHGNPQVSSVGIVTGSGASAIDTCVQEGLDLLISGEPKHEAYHKTKELKLNAIFAGHYATETFGVLALGRRLAKDFDLQIEFIDEPSGI